MLSGHPATGKVESITANEIGLTGIGVSWVYAGQDDESVYFFVYLNGRMVKRVSGFERYTDVVSLSYEDQDVQVLPWRKDQPAPNDIYGSIVSTRAHLEWTRPIDSAVGSYKVYHSESASGPFVLYDTHNKPSLETGFVSFSSGASLEIMGAYNVHGEHTNTTFTFRISDASTNSAECTNDLNDDIIYLTFSPSVPFVLLPGVVCCIEGVVADEDSAIFSIGVQPYYDTKPLTPGIHYFKVSAVDIDGDEGPLSSAVPVSVKSYPAPVSGFSVRVLPSKIIQFSGFQSITPNASMVRIYTNYDSSTNSFLDGLIEEVPHLTVPVSSDEFFSVEFLPTTALPDGMLKVSPVAVDDLGIEDGTSTVFSLSIPYMPPELPVPMSLTAVTGPAGSVTLSWITDFPAPETISEDPGEWYVSGGITAIPFFQPEPEERSGRVGYTINIGPGVVGESGEYVLTVAAVSPFDGSLGPSASVTVLIDTSAPAALAHVTGTGF